MKKIDLSPTSLSVAELPSVDSAALLGATGGWCPNWQAEQDALAEAERNQRGPGLGNGNGDGTGEGRNR
jgi:hypothetical protein